MPLNALEVHLAASSGDLGDHLLGLLGTNEKPLAGRCCQL